jgi:glutathione S-transferase
VHVRVVARRDVPDYRCGICGLQHESLARYFGAIPEAVSHAKSHSLRTVGVLATQLRQSGGPFLLGADFSAADILLVHCIDWAEAIGWGEAWTGDAGAAQVGADAENMQALADYLGRCRARSVTVMCLCRH